MRFAASFLLAAGLVSNFILKATISNVSYHLDAPAHTTEVFKKNYTPEQLSLLEKLNRSDLRHLPRLNVLVVPDRWDLNELDYSPLPQRYKWAEPYSKALIIDQPVQAFGAYEHGQLVRWGPVSSGRKAAPTPSGLFHLNWKAKGRHSTVNPKWYLPWYFNFDNDRGLSMHAYSLPGYPASHGCIRMLERDAKWIYDWGQGWQLDSKGWTVQKYGTPVLILGQYHFGQPRSWNSLNIELSVKQKASTNEPG
jgi:hypothetical protein